jgi:hypothetical protein
LKFDKKYRKKSIMKAAIALMVEFLQDSGMADFILYKPWPDEGSKVRDFQKAIDDEIKFLSRLGFELTIGRSPDKHLVLELVE